MSIVYIELDRPERGNALDAESIERLHRLLDKAEADNARGVVFIGPGKHFCTGFDLGAVDEQSDGDVLHRFVRIEALLQRIFHAPFVTIAVAHGRTFGAGADLLSACSLRLALPDVRIAFPGFRFGVALGTRRLANRVDADAARALLLEGRILDAPEALRLRLIQRVVEESQWESALSEHLSRYSLLPSTSVRSILNLTAPDTRSEDMAALVHSASSPGFRNRLLAYRATVKGAS